MEYKYFITLNSHCKVILGIIMISNKMFHQTIQAKDGIKESSISLKLQEKKTVVVHTYNIHQLYIL